MKLDFLALKIYGFVSKVFPAEVGIFPPPLASTTIVLIYAEGQRRLISPHPRGTKLCLAASDRNTIVRLH